MLKLFMGLLVTNLMLVACVSGNCRQNREAKSEIKSDLKGDTMTTPPIGKMTDDKVVDPAMTIKMFKYDGSLQCGMGSAISLAEMQKELSGINVLSSTAKADGLMRIQQCGTPTGQANVFVIEKKDYAEAKKRGFKEWTFE